MLFIDMLHFFCKQHEKYGIIPYNDKLYILLFYRLLC